MIGQSNDRDRMVGRRIRFTKFPIDGQAAKTLTQAGLTWLRTNQDTVNALNVFPVPDGDTGTNMVLTMQSACDEIADSPELNIGKMLHAVAQGALMGARGNSGVILSQLWRGFARALDGQPVLDGPVFVKAFAEARDTAYRGVVRPVEGTILTVAKDIASAVEAKLKETDDPIEILERAVSAADESLKRTPDLLPVLKEAGVVDAGGMGLFFILEGMMRWINGQPLDTAVTTVKPLDEIVLEESLESIEPGQDYEVVVDFKPGASFRLEEFYHDLEQMGTSIQVGEGDGMYRMHIHVPTEKRYEPIDYVMGLGTITKVAIENLLAQMEELEKQAQQASAAPAHVNPGEIAVVAVAPGPGIARVFTSLGVASIVQGGQTMNPSTKDILSAFENLATDKIIILPNNKNIVLAANQAAELTVKDVQVVPTRTVPQGMAAMLSHDPSGELNEVAEAMIEAAADVITGEITTAVRSVEIDGVSCQEGQIIAVMDDGDERKLTTAAGSLEEAVKHFLEAAKADDHELITLFYGAEIQRQHVNVIADHIRAAYPAQEIEIQEGGQSHYQFIISVE